MNTDDEESQMKLLQVDSSARISSVSRRLTARFAEEWKNNHPEGQVIYRDLATTVLPPITDDWGATFVDETKITPTQKLYLSTSDKLIEELEAADTVVIGAAIERSESRENVADKSTGPSLDSRSCRVSIITENAEGIPPFAIMSPCFVPMVLYRAPPPLPFLSRCDELRNTGEALVFSIRE